MTNTLSRHSCAAALAVGATLLLTGCAGNPEKALTSPATQESKQETPANDSNGPATSSPAACVQLERDANVPVDGEELGACIDAAMRAAKTGKMVLTSTPGSPATTVFEFVPEYTAYGTTDGEPTLLLTKDSGYGYSAGRWIKADPASEDPEVKIVTAGVKLAKQSSASEAIVSAAALCPQWISKGKTEIQGGNLSEGYLYQCEGSYELIGVTVSDMRIWLDDNFHMIQQKSTGSLANMTIPTVTNYSGWGEPVDMPKPEDLT